MSRTPIRLLESVGALTRGTSTTVSLAPSILHIGGFQYRTTSAIICNVTSLGAGGIDAPVVPRRLYYVYAVEANGNTTLIASLNSNGPSGYSLFRLVGHFGLDENSNVVIVYSSGAYDRELAELKISGADNYLMNGGFHFWQRHASQASGLTKELPGSTGYISVDRWRLGYNSSGVAPISWQGMLGTFAGNPLEYHLSIQGTPTSVNDNYIFEQRVESVYAQRLIGKFVSVGFWIRSTGPQSISLSIGYINAKDNFGSFNNITLPGQAGRVLATDGSWQFVSWDGIYVPVAAYNGILVQFFTTGMTNVGSIVRMDVSRIQMNIGFTVAPWRHFGGTYQAELAECQRYFCKTYPLDTPPGSPVSFNGAKSGAPAAAVNNEHLNSWYYPQRMRATPTVTPYSPQDGNIANPVWTGVHRPLSIYSVGETCVSAHVNNSSISVGNTWYVHFIASAEL